MHYCSVSEWAQDRSTYDFSVFSTMSDVEMTDRQSGKTRFCSSLCSVSVYARAGRRRTQHHRPLQQPREHNSPAPSP